MAKASGSKRAGKADDAGSTPRSASRPGDTGTRRRARGSVMAGGTTSGPTRAIRCYFCGRMQEVSPKTMSTTCPECHRAIKVEDVVVKSYLPVNDLQTCGRIRITKRGRVAAKRIQCGEGILCEGSMEGLVETDGEVQLGPKASWKGKALQSRSLTIAAGAKLDGALIVPWTRSE